MKTLHKKLRRDLRALATQAITIGLVIVAGITIMVSSQSAYESLTIARDQFYANSRFAQGFASLNRAPNSIQERLTEIPGISYLETRIVKEAILDFPEKQLPTAGKFVSLTQEINLISLQTGRLPVGENEVVVSQTFADINHLTEGSKISAVIGGKKKHLTVTGTALSPEYIYVFRPPNPMPDDEHYGILWMDRHGLSAAFDMTGGFNDLVFHFAPQSHKETVLQRIDEVLEKYGGYGAYDRDRLPSHSFLRDEFKQLKTSASMIPLVFLGIAAFLLHIVTTRIVSKDREQIATLKALGYTNRAVRNHYLKLITLITFTASIVGIACGYFLGEGMMNLYGEFYKFPKLNYRFPITVVGTGFLVGILVGITGALFSVRHVTSLQPAQAMRPPTPETFHETWIERIFSNLPTGIRMILRNLFRRPLRTILSIFGVSTAVMIMIMGNFSQGTIDFMLKIQFDTIQREDVLVSFLAPVESKVLLEFERMDAVIRSEGYRIVPVRIRVGHKYKEVALQGIPHHSELRRIVGSNYQILDPPTTGIYLNSVIAEKLGILPGQTVQLEILEGNRKKIKVVVEENVEEMLGQGAYMERTSVNRILGESDSINTIALRTDQYLEETLIRDLKDYPRIAGISTRKGILKSYKDIMERSMLVMKFFLLVFAGVIAVGVVYNTAMITLSERAFELGSLRILGFTKREVFAILAGELGILTLMALPLGSILGYYLLKLMLDSVDTEGFKMPINISSDTYTIAILTTLITMLLSFGILYRRIRSMDLLSILKVRE